MDGDDAFDMPNDLDLERIVGEVADRATKLSGAKFGAFFYSVADDKGERFLLYTLSGAPRSAFEKFGLPRNTAVFEPTFRGTGIVRSDDIRRDPRYGHNPPHRGMPEGHLPVVSYLAVPVISRSGEVHGGLFFGHDQPGVFTAETEELIGGIAAHAAIAIDNANLLQSAQREIERRRQAEQASRRFVSIVESSTDAIISKDLNSIIVSWNHGAELLFGYSAEEAVGKPIMILFPPDKLEEETTILDRIRRGESIDHYETVRIRKDGAPVDISLTVSPVKDEGGRIVGASKIARDITERRRAEQALARQAEEQATLYQFTDRLQRLEALEDVYDAGLDAILRALRCERASILLFDDAKVMRFVAWRGLSEAYREAVDGHSPWTADVRNPQTICVEDVDRAELSEALQAAVKAERIGALAFIPLVTGGRLIGKFMTYYEAPHVFAEDEINLASAIAGQLGFAVQRLRAEEARQRAEDELLTLSVALEDEVEKRTLERDRIWNVSEDLLGVSNFDGYFISINPAWTRLLGWSPDEIKSKHVSSLRHPDDATHSMEGRKQLAQGFSSVRMENRFRHKDGSWRWLQWTMIADDGLIYVAGRDVTSEKEAAAALERAQRQSAHLQKMEALGQLTGGVAHDFNNLLMVVSGHAQRLKSRVSDAKDVRSLEAIQIASSRGESLTRQLLSFSRSQPLNASVISPAAVIHAIRDVISGSMHVNVQMAIDVESETWTVNVDRSEFELALVNLAVNARDAMPDGGRLSIAAEDVRINAGELPENLAGDFVALRISDTGSGIPADILPNIFEPFFTTKQPDKGTGLGLSQVYGFARRSGGSVVVTSEMGRGTTVTIYLPRSHAPATATSPEDSAQIMAPNRETILVVEDNHDVRVVAESLLQQLGYRTIAVDSVPRALEALAASEDVELVFTDVVLPGRTDGLALARMLKDRYPAMPIVLTTGYAKVFDRDPEYPVLRKPYQIATLGRVIREALGAASQ